MKSESWAEQMATVSTGSISRQVGAIPLLYPILEALQVRQIINGLNMTEADIDLGRLVEVLTLNRLLSPRPLNHVGEWVEQSVVGTMFGLDVSQLYDQRFGRALDNLQPILAQAWVEIVSRALRQEKIDIEVLHWDTTSIYLEGEYDQSDLAAYGHSSDKRSDHKQVKIGLDVTSRERLPLLYWLLSGNRADTSTPVPNLNRIATFLERPECAELTMRPLVVGDCKMITPVAVAAAHRHHLYYLGPWESDNTVKAVIRSVSQQEWLNSELDYRPQRHFPADTPFSPYRGVWRPFPVEYGGQWYDDRALVVWSAGKERLDVDKRKRSLKKLLNRLADINRMLNSGRYIRREYAAHQIALAKRGNPAKGLVETTLSGTDRHLQLTFAIDRSALAQAQALDGKYLLGTNASHLSATQTLTLFKAQDEVEKSNRTLKGPLLIRPIYLHSDQRIESLVFIVLLALLVRGLLQGRCQRAGLSLSTDQLLAEFAPLAATALSFVDGSHLCQLGSLSPFHRQVLATLHFPAPSRYLTELQPGR
ncbi:MAG: IS1634 family transposase [Chloroflexota bacterium]|nr:IS1634 family transposase [Chloroflexota bacterium]